MESIGYTLTVGALGSVIGAAIVGLGTYGWHFTRVSIRSARERFVEERRLFHEGSNEDKSRLTNEYLFSSLQFLFVANLAWIFPEFLDAALNTSILTGASVLDRKETWIGYWITGVTFKGAGLAFFYFGFGRILRYSRVVKQLLQ